MGHRTGVSAYLEVFLLIGVATAGSGIVFGAAAGFFGSLGSPTLSIAAVSIRQGPYAAVESVTVVGSGQGSLGNLVITTSGVPSSSTFCYSILDPVSRSALSSTCPTLQPNPGTLSVSPPSGAGISVLVELVIVGNIFTPGSSHLVTVTSSGGAQQSSAAQVVPG